MTNTHNHFKKLILFSLLATITFVLKLILSWLPNIELSSVLITTFTMCFGLESLYIVGVYILLEIIVYGFSTWAIGYLYIWAVLVFIIYFTWNKWHSFVIAIILTSLFGLLFGALYIPLYMTIGNLNTAITWWIAGISYDLLHCLGNTVTSIILLKPIYKLLTQLQNKYGFLS